MNALTPLPWMSRAACTTPTADPEWFFNETQGGETLDTRLALKTCRYCPVLRICQEWTLEQDMLNTVTNIYGVQGGMTQGQRRRRRKASA